MVAGMYHIMALLIVVAAVVPFIFVLTVSMVMMNSSALTSGGVSTLSSL